jgi:hypothetical protein
MGYLSHGSQPEKIAVLKLNENIYGTDGRKAGASANSNSIEGQSY